MLTALTLATLLAAPGDLKTPDTLQPLADQLNAICLKFGGRIGYSLKTLRDGKQISFRGDEVFPSASTIKTGVMIAAIQMVDDGKMTWKDTRVVPKLENREASMWSYWFREGTKCDLDGWVNLMVGVSDNTATMVVRDWIGTLEVNRRLEALGLKRTKILGNAPESATEIRRLRTIYGMGMTTPNEMLRLLELVHQRKAASEAGCDKAIRILAKQYWDDWIAGAVPPSVRSATKSGAITRSRSDTGIVYSYNPYLLTIYTDDQKDRRWAPDNEGDLTIVKMSGLVWNYLHPSQPYTPPPGFEKFTPTGGGVEDSG